MATLRRSSEDFRRFPHKPYLDRAQLVRRPWRETRPGWDHDHCEFCFAEFADARLPNALHEGFCTLYEYHWICEDCAKELNDEYHFAILEEANLPTAEQVRIQFEITSERSPGRKLGRSFVAYDGSGRVRDYSRE